MSNQPKYYRLLEKGEKIEKGDMFSDGNEMLVTICAGSNPESEGFHYFRPIPAPDLWQEYAKVKPTKEDFEPTGRINGISESGAGATYSESYLPQTCYRIAYWRRITPPERPKTKSAVVHIGCRSITIFANGTGRVNEGDNIETSITKEQIDAFIAARQEVMKQ